MSHLTVRKVRFVTFPKPGVVLRTHMRSQTVCATRLTRPSSLVRRRTPSAAASTAVSLLSTLMRVLSSVRTVLNLSSQVAFVKSMYQHPLYVHLWQGYFRVCLRSPQGLVQLSTLLAGWSCSCCYPHHRCWLNIMLGADSHDQNQTLGSADDRSSSLRWQLFATTGHGMMAMMVRRRCCRHLLLHAFPA